MERDVYYVVYDSIGKRFAKIEGFKQKDIYWTKNLDDSTKYTKAEYAFEDIEDTDLKSTVDVLEVTVTFKPVVSPLKNYKESRLKNQKKFLKEENEFVPGSIDQFLRDVAQFSNLFNYTDISAFERDVFAPNDKNVKALKKLYMKAKSAAKYDDEEEINHIYRDVADIIIGIVDYEQN